MTNEPAPLTGPDLAKGVDIGEVPASSPLLGHVQGEAVVVVRSGHEFFAISGTCSHYGGPLAEGLVEHETIRCPWHHACFNLRTGEAQAPALNSIDCYQIEQRDQRLYVLSKRRSIPATLRSNQLERVLIVGGGAAGNSAAETLRHQGYVGKITLLTADDSGPVDRPNLSKDYLAGTAPEEWVPLRPADFYHKEGIDLLLGTRVATIDSRCRRVVTQGGESHAFDALLIATGAEPAKLAVPGSDLPQVHYLRTLKDCQAIIDARSGAETVLVVGASFIGLEVAAALRTRGLNVHVVAPDQRPLERIMGAAIGDFVRALHEEHGVVFHLGNGIERIEPGRVLLTDGVQLACDLVVAGIGVRPNLGLAEQSGLTIDRGILVNEYLETSVPGIYAAGDIARWPDPHTGQNIRVEHWVVAQRHGEIVARNMLGQKRRCNIVPYFWSQHYDVAISYVGHAEQWDQADATGSLQDRRYTLALRKGEKTLAVITLGRDLESLRAEVAFERVDKAALAAIGK
jgi:NADPH-dependent 2,4-dienoyl-CoA reductase/sulfur reductase-like enzyme/nitrite reductase/ring-hydroxylating ferredoxin subunit